LLIVRDTNSDEWLGSIRQFFLFQGVSLSVILVWLVPGVINNISSGAFSSSLDLNHTKTSSSVESACPPGSRVLVWGWASEFYVNYDWRSAIPFLATAQLVWTPENTLAAAGLVKSGIEAADCVVDATGPPFFAMTSENSLVNTYPWAESMLEEDFRLSDLGVECENCRLWVKED
jgi:hypothetical protein